MERPTTTIEDIENLNINLIEKNAAIRDLFEQRISFRDVYFSKDLINHLLNNIRIRLPNHPERLFKLFKNSRLFLNQKVFKYLNMKCTECNEIILNDLHFTNKSKNIGSTFILKSHCANRDISTQSFNLNQPLFLFNKSIFQKPIPVPTRDDIKMSKDDDCEYDYEEEITKVNPAIPRTKYENFYLKMCEDCGKYLPEIESISHHLLKNPTHTVIRKNVIYLYRLMDQKVDANIEIPPDSFQNNGQIFNDISIDQVFE